MLVACLKMGRKRFPTDGKDVRRRCVQHATLLKKTKLSQRPMQFYSITLGGGKLSTLAKLVFDSALCSSCTDIRT